MTRRRGELLAGLWEPPIVEVAKSENSAVQARRLAGALRALGVRTTLVRGSEDIRHRITHRDIRVSTWTGAVRRDVARTGPRGRASTADDLRWVDPEQPGVALTGVARKLMGKSDGPAGRGRRDARGR